MREELFTGDYSFRGNGIQVLWHKFPLIEISNPMLDLISKEFWAPPNDVCDVMDVISVTQASSSVMDLTENKWYT
jgi:hypothetical protein